jgi:hypothetical protein
VQFQGTIAVNLLPQFLPVLSVQFVEYRNEGYVVSSMNS